MQRERRISDQLVRLVQIVFGVVLGQSLLRYGGTVGDPLATENYPAALGLLAVYVTTVLSWVGWHFTMELHPYNLNPRNRHRLSEWTRLWADLAIVTVYAYLLVTIEPLTRSPQADLTRHLIGYPVAFALYFLAGIARRRAYGRYASEIGSIIGFGLLFVGLVLAYSLIDWSQLGLISCDSKCANVSAVSAALGITVFYRIYRTTQSRRRRTRKERGLVIGIDVDGVLGNQIHGVIPRVRTRHAIDLKYEDVTDWRLPIGDSDIATEILASIDDPEYILGMPVHNGAQRLLERLYDENQIYVLTARPTDANDLTRQWLEAQALPHDKLFNVKEEKKSLYRTDVLIDDYVGNIVEYLENTNGLAIMVDQPWNRTIRAGLQRWIDSGRLKVVQGLDEILSQIEEAGQQRRARTGQEPS